MCVCNYLILESNNNLLYVPTNSFLIFTQFIIHTGDAAAEVAVPHLVAVEAAASAGAGALHAGMLYNVISIDSAFVSCEQILSVAAASVVARAGV